MNIIILGPKGSGKGTQAEMIVRDFGLKYMEMGATLRSIAASDNKYASKVRESMEEGNMVPDEFVRLIAWDFIRKNEEHPNEPRVGFLFDGYPRSLPQYEHLQDMLRKFGEKIDKVIFINISETESIKRLSARRTCEKCREIYNLVTNKPKDPIVCDKCGGRLLQRDDDQPEAIKRRLQLYHERTQPIIIRARDEGVALEIDGERPIDSIYSELTEKLR